MTRRTSPTPAGQVRSRAKRTRRERADDQFILRCCASHILIDEQVRAFPLRFMLYKARLASAMKRGWETGWPGPPAEQGESGTRAV